jgi:hypothetical protein
MDSEPRSSLLQSLLGLAVMVVCVSWAAGVFDPGPPGSADDALNP